MTDINVFFSPRAEELEEAIRKGRFIDDEFFSASLDDNPEAAEAIIRTALSMPDIIVKRVTAQRRLTLVGSHSVVLDAEAVTPEGHHIDIEIQRQVHGDIVKRGRYYLAAMTTKMLQEGEAYHNLRDAYVLFLCESDPFKEGKAVYSYIMKNKDETSSPLHDGTQLTFFNCAYKGKDAYGQLAADMITADYRSISDPVLSKTSQSVKIGDRKKLFMSEYWEKKYKEIEDIGIAKGKAEGLAQGKAEGLVQGKAEGLAQGKADGKAEATRAIVAALLRDGSMPVEKIAELAQVPVSDVLAVREEEGIR